MSRKYFILLVRVIALEVLFAVIENYSLFRRKFNIEHYIPSVYANNIFNDDIQKMLTQQESKNGGGDPLNEFSVQL